MSVVESWEDEGSLKIRRKYGMYKLDDSKLLAQCDRIKAMVEEIARTPARQKDYYASSYHHWKISPTVPLSDIRKFEKQVGIELPVEYVYYLTQVGRGGACPGTFFEDFDPEQKVEEWEELYGDGDWEGDQEDKTIHLCDMDLTYVAYLIVTGPQRGRVVYIDYNGDMMPMYPKGSPDFLTWCENFYSELLAGYDIKPTWKFMWQEPGDAHALIYAFQNAEDQEYRKEVIYSFGKFKELSQEAYQFLESLQTSEWKEEVAEVLKEFPMDKNRYKKYELSICHSFLTY